MTQYNPVQQVVQRLYDQYVSAQDQALLDMVFDPMPTQEALDACMQKADIEVLGGGKAILLSYLMHDHPELKLNAYAGPRISGLLRYYRFANVETLAHFARLGKAFNQAGIAMLLFKGGAMKALRPALSRPMGDVDILVHKADLQQAVNIAESMGYEHTRGESCHAVNLHNDRLDPMDVHYSIFDPDGRDLTQFHAGLFQRATARRAFGIEVLFPSHEDLYFLVMTNLTKNLRQRQSLGNIYFALCDCRYLLADKKDFDWDIVRQNITASGRQLETRFAAEFMNAIVPGIVPDMDEHFPLTHEATAFARQIIFDENHFLQRQAAAQAIRVVELKNHPWRYGKQIVKFLLLKKLRKSPRFVEWYLRTHYPTEIHHAH